MLLFQAFAIVFALSSGALGSGEDCGKQFPKLQRRNFLKITTSAFLAAIHPLPTPPVKRSIGETLNLILRDQHSKIPEWIFHASRYRQFGELLERAASKKQGGENQREPRKGEEKPPELQKQDIANMRLVIFQPHLSQSGTEVIVETIVKEIPDWIALEIFPRELQSSVDHYLQADRNSDTFQLARKALSHFLAMEGESRGVTGENHPAMGYLEAARNKHTPVYAIGLATGSNTAFHELLPEQGIGLIATDQTVQEADPARFQTNRLSPLTLINDGT
jgi:hypothetical protein